MPRSRNRTIGLLALLGMTGLLWLFWPRPRPLMAVAVKVASVDGWLIDRGPDACMSWGWASNREIIHLYEKGHGREFFRLDTTTGVRTPLPALTKLFNKTNGDPDGVEISPDGRWVMWHGKSPGRQDDASYVFIANTDATQHRRWPLGKRSGFTRWLGDSNHWTMLQMSPNFKSYEQAVIYRLDSTPPVQKIPIPKTHPLNQGSFYGVYQLLCGVVPTQDRILVHTWNWKTAPPARPDIAVADLSLRENLKPDRTFKVRAPKGVEVADLLFSPQGDYLAWKLRHPPAATPLVFLSNWVPSLKPPRRTMVSLWVSRIDGSGMREIGYQERREENAELYMLEPDSLRWTPDGKGLSFLYRDALYVVPIK